MIWSMNAWALIATTFFARAQPKGTKSQPNPESLVVFTTSIEKNPRMNVIAVSPCQGVLLKVEGNNSAQLMPTPTTWRRAVQ
mmetsp:Transcript_32092/g.96171  ORF Transcript_32092/g.96171 Transcript_32092/m.96171 type:complete len:82 (+) Transcript_32092:957-1202(+)